MAGVLENGVLLAVALALAMVVDAELNEASVLIALLCDTSGMGPNKSSGLRREMSSSGLGRFAPDVVVPDCQRFVGLSTNSSLYTSHNCACATVVCNSIKSWIFTAMDGMAINPCSSASKASASWANILPPQLVPVPNALLQRYSFSPAKVPEAASQF